MFSLLGSVFVASVLGSLHCVGMCGPFVTLASARADRVHLPQIHPLAAGARPGRSGTLSPARSWVRRGLLGPVTLYNLGRLVLYVVLGALGGAVGSLLDAGGSMVGLQAAATGLAGATMIVAGAAGLARHFGLFARLRWPAGGGRLAPLTHTLRRLPPSARALALGAMAALMPCGWLYAFVLTATSTGSALLGGAVMSAFWLGTVPALSVLGVSITRASHRLRRHIGWLMPMVVLAAGVYAVGVRARVPAPRPLAPTPPSNSVPSEAPSCH